MMVTTPSQLEDAIKEAQITNGTFYQRFWSGDRSIDIGFDGVGFVAMLNEAEGPRVLNDMAADDLLPLSDIPVH